jgi:cytochrome c553
MSLPKKILKFSGYALGGVVAVVSIALAVVYVKSNSRLHRRYSVQVSPVTVPNTLEAIERGGHIVTTRACSDCHDTSFAGKKVIDDPLAGLFYGANITKGKGGLPEDYADIDYVRALRHGVGRDGRPLVLMPSHEYTHLSDEDLGAVIAFLKSVPPVDRATVPLRVGPMIRALLVMDQVKLAAENIDHTSKREATVTAGINPTYGKYLATSCIGCHGDNLSGGKIVGAPPDWPAAANLTKHPTSRVATWTEEQFIKTIRTKVRPDGTALSPIMPAAFGSMTDEELKALWTYIESLPAAATGQRS